MTSLLGIFHLVNHTQVVGIISKVHHNSAKTILFSSGLESYKNSFVSFSFYKLLDFTVRNSCNPLQL